MAARKGFVLKKGLRRFGGPPMIEPNPLKFPSPKNTNTMKYALLLLLVALTSCATVDKFASSPEGRKVLGDVQTVVIAAANDAIQQYADTGKVKGKEVAVASL